MKLRYTTLARYVELAPDNTFTIVGGGFHRIRVSDFPITVPSLAMLIKIWAAPEEQGEYRLTIVLLDPDGKRMDAGSTEIPFIVDQEADHREFTCMFQMFQVEFQRPGIHQFQIGLASGPELGTMKLSVELPIGAVP